MQQTLVEPVRCEISVKLKYLLRIQAPTGIPSAFGGSRPAHRWFGRRTNRLQPSVVCGVFIKMGLLEAIQGRTRHASTTETV